MMESYPELTSPIKANYPQSPWKILNGQFMQVFLIVLSLYLLPLQLHCIFKLSFVIIKQQCKQLSQKPLLKLLEMISSVLHIWPKKSFSPMEVFTSFCIDSQQHPSQNRERDRTRKGERTGFFLSQYERTQMLNDQNFPLDSQWGVNGTVWMVSLPLERIDKNIVFSQPEPQKLLNHFFWDHLHLPHEDQSIKCIFIWIYALLKSQILLRKSPRNVQNIRDLNNVTNWVEICHVCNQIQITLSIQSSF